VTESWVRPSFAELNRETVHDSGVPLPMNPPVAERLQDAVSQARWNEAVTLLQSCDAVQAAAALGSLPFEQQQSLFRRLPRDLAAPSSLSFPTITNTSCCTRCRGRNAAFG